MVQILNTIYKYNCKKILAEIEYCISNDFLQFILRTQY